jgi:nucleoside-diphosphate-sugar epimerase
MRKRRIAVLENGGWCNLIYVDDLVSAIEAALDVGTYVATPLFLTDGHPIPWAQYLDEHAALLGCKLPRVPRSLVAPSDVRREGAIQRRMHAGLGLMFSGGGRRFLTRSPLRPLTEKAYRALRRSPRLDAMLQAAAGQNSSPNGPGRLFDHDWLFLQLSEARLDPTPAREALGFVPDTSFPEGLDRTASWLDMLGYLLPLE